jgi:hypothetical protein
MLRVERFPIVCCWPPRNLLVCVPCCWRLLNRRLKPNSPARWAPAVGRGADQDLARAVEGAALPVREVVFPVAAVEELAPQAAVAAVRAARVVQGPVLQSRRYVGKRWSLS